MSNLEDAAEMTAILVVVIILMFLALNEDL